MTEETRVESVLDQDESDGLDELRASVDADPVATAAYRDAARRGSFLGGMRRIRKGAKLTQKSMANKMGTTQPALSELESGRVDPQLRTLQRYARAGNRRLDFAMVDPSMPVFDENMAHNLWQWAQINMLGPLLTAIATQREKRRTLAALSEEVRFPESVVEPVLTSLQERRWVTTTRGEFGEVYSLGVAGYVIGISIERDRVIGVLVDLRGQRVGSHVSASLRDTLRRTVVDEAVKVVAHLYEARDQHVILGVGVSIAGVVTSETGRVHFAPDLRTDDDLWDDVPLEDLLQAAVQKRVKDQNLRVAVENDANCLAMLEYLRNRSHSVMVTLLSGTGIGVGLVIRGHVVHGAQSAAGEAGHVIVDPDGAWCRAGFRHQGCMETVASAKAILQRLSEHLAQIAPNTTPVAWSTSADLHRGLAAANALASQGSQEAIKAFSDAGDVVGRFLSTTVTLLNPARVVLYGHRELMDSSLRSAAAFQEGINEGLEASGRNILEPPEREWRVMEEPDNALAAGATALRYFLSDPSHWQPAVVDQKVEAGEWTPLPGENDEVDDDAATERTTREPATV